MVCVFQQSYFFLSCLSFCKDIFLAAGTFSIVKMTTRKKKKVKQRSANSSFQNQLSSCRKTSVWEPTRGFNCCTGKIRSTTADLNFYETIFFYFITTTLQMNLMESRGLVIKILIYLLVEACRNIAIALEFSLITKIPSKI